MISAWIFNILFCLYTFILKLSSFSLPSFYSILFLSWLFSSSCSLFRHLSYRLSIPPSTHILIVKLIQFSSPDHPLPLPPPHPSPPDPRFNPLLSPNIRSASQRMGMDYDTVARNLRDPLHL